MTNLIENKLDTICNITDIPERINKLQSIFPSWDNIHLKELAERGCNMWITPSTPSTFESLFGFNITDSMIVDGIATLGAIYLVGNFLMYLIGKILDIFDSYKRTHGSTKSN